MTDVCGYCNEKVDADYAPPNGAEQASLAGRLAHNECALRCVLGGIGHLTNHRYWCLVVGDCDAGLSYRASGLMVFEWVKDNGTLAAINIAVAASMESGEE